GCVCVKRRRGSFALMTAPRYVSSIQGPEPAGKSLCGTNVNEGQRGNAPLLSPSLSPTRPWHSEGRQRGGGGAVKCQRWQGTRLIRERGGNNETAREGERERERHNEREK